MFLDASQGSPDNMCQPEAVAFAEEYAINSSFIKTCAALKASTKEALTEIGNLRGVFAFHRQSSDFLNKLTLDDAVCSATGVPMTKQGEDVIAFHTSVDHLPEIKSTGLWSNLAPDSQNAFQHLLDQMKHSSKEVLRRLGELALEALGPKIDSLERPQDGWSKVEGLDKKLAQINEALAMLTAFGPPTGNVSAQVDRLSGYKAEISAILNLNLTEEERSAKEELQRQVGGDKKPRVSQQAKGLPQWLCALFLVSKSLVEHLTLLRWWLQKHCCRPCPCRNCWSSQWSSSKTVTRSQSRCRTPFLRQQSSFKSLQRASLWRIVLETNFVRSHRTWHATSKLSWLHCQPALC